MANYGPAYGSLAENQAKVRLFSLTKDTQMEILSYCCFEIITTDSTHRSFFFRLSIRVISQRSDLVLGGFFFSRYSILLERRNKQIAKTNTFSQARQATHTISRNNNRSANGICFHSISSCISRRIEAWTTESLEILNTIDCFFLSFYRQKCFIGHTLDNHIAIFDLFRLQENVV